MNTHILLAFFKGRLLLQTKVFFLVHVLKYPLKMKGTHKGKNLLPSGAKFFPVRAASKEEGGKCFNVES